MLSLVIKRRDGDEKFNEKKLYGSVFASLMACRATEKEAELISEEVTKLVRRWVANKSHVSSHDLRLEVAKHLRDYNHIAAYVYTHHRILS